MNSDDTTFSVLVCFVLSGFLGGLIFSGIVEKHTDKYWKQEAVKHDKAEWIVKPDGSIGFKWK